MKIWEVQKGLCKRRSVNDRSKQKISNSEMTLYSRKNQKLICRPTNINNKNFHFGEYKNKNTRAIKIQVLLWEKDFNAGMMEDYNLSLSEG